jgi:signal transduction histidine kinase
VTINHNCSLDSNYQSLCFEISDTGIGIPGEQLEHIFTPFEQLGSASQKSEGTGLGLSIAQKILRLMNSEIKVESSLGVGSTFSFILNLPTSEAEKIHP